MKIYWLLLGILAVWQITSMLHAGEGPWSILRQVRLVLIERQTLRAIACFYCLTVWIALPLALWIGESWPERVLLWFALAGGASALQRVIEAREPAPAQYVEDAPAEAKHPMATREPNPEESFGHS
jgi:hypothetical protein